MNDPFEAYAQAEARLDALVRDCLAAARRPELRTEVESLLTNHPKSLPPKGGESED